MLLDQFVLGPLLRGPFLSVCMFAVSIVERSIAARSVVSDFNVLGSFVAEKIVCGVHIC